MRLRNAFTLVELVAVIVILAVISVVAVPRFLDTSEKAKVTAIAANLKMIRRAIIEYQAVHGVFPPDQNGGIMPPELGAFLANDVWSYTITGIGVYNWEGPPGWANHEAIGIGSLVSVPVDPTADPFWLAIDRQIDDGVLITGYFRWDAGSTRYEFFLND